MSLTITQRTRTRVAFLTGAMLLVALALAQLADPVGTTWRDGVLVASSVLAGLPIAVRAWQALRARAFSIDLLVTIAVVGALVIGEYVESAVVSFLFLFGAWLEGRSLERTRASLRELVDLAPTRATVLRDGSGSSSTPTTSPSGRRSSSRTASALPSTVSSGPGGPRSPRPRSPVSRSP
jgi:Cd2+/Zn2+-exporting ATPase